ncbi:HD domain-containing protein [Gandjariella thermophila]|uniref:Metal-dependent phosphohydrolase, HD subdomain protein n=1 Tax=Gandjariella thermophila TaxID=1931992 RepID=A0A4D4J876_9PSEU|nr:HD domain-containing protein [Gandjariella thermophila]GDY33005.1 metal-dependent phosphohydrolase, HD subdomain protein [Gandjariella thermophila]
MTVGVWWVDAVPRVRCVDLMAWAHDVASERLAEALPRRWVHVQGVAERATEVAKLFAEDADLLVAAAVLHDVGYAPELAVTGFHPLDGARFLRTTDAPARLVNLVAHHSCAYREAELRGLSAELAEFTDEETPLRDALWWADMTTGPDGQRLTVHERIAEIQSRYGPDDLVTWFIRQAKPELVAAVERTEARARAAGLVTT